MSTNGIWHSRYEHEDGYGDTYWSQGVVNIVEGRVFLDSTSLEQWMKRLEGQVVGFEFVTLPRLKDYGTFDASIQPLVSALQSLGIRTLNSCEGHMELHYNYLIKYPYIDFWAGDKDKLPSLPEAWTIQVGPSGDSDILRLRTKDEATDPDHLAQLQREALELADKITKPLDK